MVELSIKMDVPPRLKKWLDNSGPYYKKYLEKADGRALKHLKEAIGRNPKTPKKSGDMARSFQADVRNRKLFSTLPKAAAHEKGAYITPKRAKLLHWVDNGKDIFAKVVRLKATHYVESTVNQEEKRVAEIYSKTFREMLERV